MKTKARNPLHIRSDAKFSGIADTLRRELIEGKVAPKAKMPTWTQLCKRFDIGRPTLTRVLELLKEEGFVIADSTRGTYVAENLPNLHRYALLFPVRKPSGEKSSWNLYWDNLTLQAATGKDVWNLYWESLDQQSAVGGFANGDYVKPIYGVHPELTAVRIDQDGNALPEQANAGWKANLGWQMSVRQARNGSLAGILVAFNSAFAELQNEVKDVPVVSLGWDEKTPIRYTVAHDWRCFEEMAVAELARQGARRIAVLSSHPDIARGCARSAIAHGCECPIAWQQTVGRQQWPETVRNLMNLMFCGRADKIPDGLVIADDNLLEPALAGIADTGIEPGRNLLVIAHGNIPAVEDDHPGVRRLCYSAKTLIETAINLAREARANGIPERHDLIQPVFL